MKTVFLAAAILVLALAVFVLAILVHAARADLMPDISDGEDIEAES